MVVLCEARSPCVTSARKTLALWVLLLVYNLAEKTFLGPLGDLSLKVRPVRSRMQGFEPHIPTLLMMVLLKTSVVP